MTMKSRIGCVLAMALAGHFGGGTSRAESYYTSPQLFSTAPGLEKSAQSIDRIGPVGIGIELVQPAFVMKVQNVEPGSPAATSGKLKPGQIIETINGEKLHDIDPRVQLGNLITAAEASDGQVKLMIKDTPADAAHEVVIQIPVLGAYSPTWPLNCPKSDKIVRNFAEYLTKPDSNKGFADIGMLFLLSTGEEKDLEPVRNWVHGLKDKAATAYAWFLGYGGIGLCEYYLRTGDPEALPIIQKWVDSATKAEYLDGWNGRGGVAAVTYGGGGGHLNAGGTHCLTFILLAKECGANVNEDMLRRTLVHYYRFANRGNNPYGDNRPEGSFVDNGKNGLVSFTMAAAASLTPDGENSVYAKARDASAMMGFYTTTFMLHGHTGGGIGEIWRSTAMMFLKDKKPAQYRDFLDSRRWHYELSRRWDGSFGILGGARYDEEQWGAGYALTYTIPRKTLRVSGAPKTKFSHEYKLPDHPWGTAADEVFNSLQPAPDASGKVADLSGETIAHDSGRSVITRLLAIGDVSDDVLNQYIRHPDPHIRDLVANNAFGMKFDYMWAKPGNKVRMNLIKEWVASPDPRVRHAALLALSKFTPQASVDNEAGDDAQNEKVPPLSQDLFDKAMSLINNPDESWWVKDAALAAVSRGTADMIAPHVDEIIPYLKHQEWWLQSRAISALTPVAADERCYQKVLPVVGDFIRTCQRYNATSSFHGFCDQLVSGSPQVQALARQTIGDSYSRFTGVRTWAGGQDVTKTYDSQLEFLAKSLAEVPGGYDILFEVAKKRFPNDSLPYDKIFLTADFDQFSPELLSQMKPIIRDRLIYQYMGASRTKILEDASAVKQAYFVGGPGPLSGLVSLYQKIGIHEYDWHDFGPDMKNAKWFYHMFDPPEKQAYDISPWRYRKITLPAGMESWFKPDFDPAKAGWQQGQAPFGQYNGKLITDMNEMAKIKTRGTSPMRTMWDKEVLMMRGTFEFPTLQPGHLYRLMIGDSVNVGTGDGYRIYVNGKLLIEVEDGIGRRQGGRPRGAFITKNFLGEFGKGPVTIAATSFLRYGEKSIITMPPVPQGTFGLWMEEMNLPPLDDATFQKSATLIAMVDANWQSKQDPENAELSPDDNRFLYDGKFIANPAVPGEWKTVAVVPTVDAFNPKLKSDVKKAPYKSLSFKEGGTTSLGTLIWSGDTLMDMVKNQAVKMTAKTIDSQDYLFIEVGGFSQKNPPTWKSPLVVLKRDK